MASNTSSLEDIAALKNELYRLALLKVRNEYETKLVKKAVSLDTNDGYAVKEFIADARAASSAPVMGHELCKIVEIEDEPITKPTAKPMMLDWTPDDAPKSRSMRHKQKRGSINDDGASVISAISTMSNISSLTATLVATKVRVVSAKTRERLAKKEEALVDKIEQLRQEEKLMRAKRVEAANNKALDEAVEIQIKEKQNAKDDKAVDLLIKRPLPHLLKRQERKTRGAKIAKEREENNALEREKQDAKARTKAIEIQKKKDRDALKAKIAREKEEEKQRKFQEAKDKAAALEREKQEAKARAKAIDIQKKKDREAIKAKIAREKEEEKQKQIQQAKDKQAAKIAMKQKMIQDAKDKAAAIEQEKREAKARAKALEAQKKKDEALAKVLQVAKDRAAAIEQQRVLKEAEEARAKRELEELEAKIASERARRKKAAEERAVAKEREKKLAEKKIAEEKAAAIKEATMMENIAMKDLEEAKARIEHARQVKMEVNEKFKTPSKGPSKSSNKMQLSIKKQSKTPEISESRSEIEDVNVSSIEMNDARDVAPGVVDPKVMTQEKLKSLRSELKQAARYEDDVDMLSRMFKWPTCFWEDLCSNDSSTDGSDFLSGESGQLVM